MNVYGNTYLLLYRVTIILLLYSTRFSYCKNSCRHMIIVCYIIIIIIITMLKTSNRINYSIFVFKQLLSNDRMRLGRSGNIAAVRFVVFYLRVRDLRYVLILYAPKTQTYELPTLYIEICTNIFT